MPYRESEQGNITAESNAAENKALEVIAQPNLASYMACHLTLRHMLIAATASQDMKNSLSEAIQRFTKSLTREFFEAKYDVDVANSLRLRKNPANTLPSGARDKSLCIAAQHGHLHVLEALITQGIEISYNESRVHNGNPAIEVATQHGKVNSVCVLLTGRFVELSLPNKHNQTVLYAAIVYHQPVILQLLINAGANVTATQNLDDKRTTLLYEAVKRGQIDSVDILINANANPNILGKPHGFFFTATDLPLLLAINQQSVKIVELLLNAGADPLITVRDGVAPTPLEAAKSTGNIEILTLLENKIANNSASEALKELCQYKLTCQNKPNRSRFSAFFNLGIDKKDKLIAIESVMDALNACVTEESLELIVEAKHKAVLADDDIFSGIISRLEHGSVLRLQFDNQPCNNTATL